MENPSELLAGFVNTLINQNTTNHFIFLFISSIFWSHYSLVFFIRLLMNSSKVITSYPAMDIYRVKLVETQNKKDVIGSVVKF